MSGKNFIVDSEKENYEMLVHGYCRLNTLWLNSWIPMVLLQLMVKYFKLKTRFAAILNVHATYPTNLYRRQLKGIGCLPRLSRRINVEEEDVTQAILEAELDASRLTKYSYGTTISHHFAFLIKTSHTTTNTYHHIKLGVEKIEAGPRSFAAITSRSNETFNLATVLRRFRDEDEYEVYIDTWLNNNGNVLHYQCQVDRRRGTSLHLVWSSNIQGIEVSQDGLPTFRLKWRMNPQFTKITIGAFREFIR